jgi:hypothetical protein
MDFGSAWAVVAYVYPATTGTETAARPRQVPADVRHFLDAINDYQSSLTELLSLRYTDQDRWTDQYNELVYRTQAKLDDAMRLLSPDWTNGSNHWKAACKWKLWTQKKAKRLLDDMERNDVSVRELIQRIRFDIPDDTRLQRLDE